MSEKGTFVNVGGDSKGYSIGVGSSNFNIEGNELIYLNDGLTWHATGQDIGTGWHHVAFTIDGSYNTTVYLDGKSILDFNELPYSPSNYYSYIGASDKYSAEPRNLSAGKIDEIRFWNTALSESDIRQNMYRELPEPLDAELVTYYKLNETSNTGDWIDSKGNYNGWPINLASTACQASSAFFGPKNCLNFDGGLQTGSPDYAYKTSNVTSVTDNFTMMAWVKPDDVSNGAVWRCVAYNGDDDGGYGIGIKETKVTGLFGTNLWAITNEVLTTGNWYHITMRRSSGTVQFFLNGELLSYSNTTDPNAPSAKFTIGNMYSNDGSSIYTDSFDGKIDEVRVYDAALTDNQIIENMCTSLVGDEDNLVAYYNFDNSTGTTLQAFDGSTTNDLTLVNMSDVDWVTSSAFNTWLNTTGTDWLTATNWSRGSVPSTSTPYDNVGIPDFTSEGGSDPVFGTSATCNNLVVGADAALDFNSSSSHIIHGSAFVIGRSDIRDNTFLTITKSLYILPLSTLVIDPGGELTIGDKLVNWSLCTIGSTSAGTGSLIVEGTATGNVTMQRYMNDAVWTDWEDGWHFLSSPVTEQAISTTFTTGTYDFYCWWELTNEWINFKNTTTAPTWATANVISNTLTESTDNFKVGKGYMAAYDEAGIKSFTGTLNNDNVIISDLTIAGTSGTNRSWHLLGNPYSSGLTWDGTWNLVNITGTAEIWNEDIQSYSAITSGVTIPATNGFMVQVSSGTGSLTIPKAGRVHGGAFYKNVDFPVIKLKANNIDYPSAQESQLLFNPESTDNWDLEFDGDFLPGYAPYFYSKIDDQPMAVNSMPNVEETTTIPFTFIKNEGLNFSIEMYEVENMAMDVWLLDRKLNKTQNLSLNPVYVFTAFEQDDHDRFVIHFSPLGIDEPTTPQELIQIWASNHTINIHNANNYIGDIKVVNMYGQTVLTTKLDGNQTQQFRVDAPSGYYIINTITKKGVVNKKVYLR